MYTYLTADGRVIHKSAVRVEYKEDYLLSITEIFPAYDHGDWSHMIVPGLIVSVLWLPEIPDERLYNYFSDRVMQWARTVSDSLNF